MTKIQVNFGDPEHGWMNFSVFNDNLQVLRYEISDIYPSFDLLVDALSAMLDGREERLVFWALEPSEIEFKFSRPSDVDEIQLEITLFESSERSHESRTSDFRIIGTYDEICFPFWSALRELQSRCFAEKLEEDWRWTSEFPTRELALLSARLSKI